MIHNGIPVLGVVYAPALVSMYWAKKKAGAYKTGNKQLPLKVKHEIQNYCYKSHMNEETQAFVDEIQKQIGKSTIING